MLIKHIGLGIRRFYTLASFFHKGGPYAPYHKTQSTCIFGKITASMQLWNTPKSAVPLCTHGAQFAALVKEVFPGHIRQVLSDNGSEFADACACYAKEQRGRHCFTGPKYPKMHACVERFNRTLQEEYVDYEKLLLEDIRGCNGRLLSYSVLA